MSVVYSKDQTKAIISVYNGDWTAIEYIEDQKYSLQYRAMTDSRGKALKLMKKPLATIITSTLTKFPEALDYINEEELQNLEELHIFVVKTHFKYYSHIIENLNVFKDKAYFAYIKLAAGV